MEAKDIRNNYLRIKSDVEKIAKNCGRDPRKIRLIAVSKTKPIEYVKAAMEAGALDFGENRPQELKEKYEAINTPVWHQIGHLQKNKVRYVVGKAEFIHSIDSIELAKEIDKRADRLNLVQKVLIQVNVTGEDTKFGIEPQNLSEFLSEIRSFKNINVTGLMTISVKGYERSQNLEVFKKLKNLAHENGLYELSMGMTHDYPEAIEAGATMIRVGTAIFGERDYSNI